MFKRAFALIFATVASNSFAIVVDSSFGQNGVTEYADSAISPYSPIKISPQDIIADQQGRHFVVGYSDSSLNAFPFVLALDNQGKIDSSFGKNGAFGYVNKADPFFSMLNGYAPLTGSVNAESGLSLIGGRGAIELSGQGAYISNRVFSNVANEFLLDEVMDKSGNVYVLNVSPAALPYTDPRNLAVQVTKYLSGSAEDYSFGNAGTALIDWNNPNFIYDTSNISQLQHLALLRDDSTLRTSPDAFVSPGQQLPLITRDECWLLALR